MMKTYDDGGRHYTVHLCAECGHRDTDHVARPQGTHTCSMGWCPCRVPAATVVADNPPKECVTIPGAVLC